MTDFNPSEVATYYRAQMPKLNQRGAEWRCPCPIHNGKRDSFAVNPNTGRAFCHSNCGKGWDILGLEQALNGSDFEGARSEVFKIVGRLEFDQGSKAGRIVAEYPYTNAAGDLLYQVVRLEPKGFRQRRPDGRGGWTWNLKGVDPVPYKLPEVFGASSVYIVEGERDVETLEKWGLVATCNSGGAGKWRRDFGGYFEAKHVCILPDQDEPGQKHAIDVATSLIGTAASVRQVDLPGAKDVTAWAQVGGTFEQLRELVRATPATPALGSVVSQPDQQVSTPRTDDIEQAILAAILADRSLYVEVASRLTPDSFEGDARLIFARMVEVAKTKVVDSLTVAEEIKSRGEQVALPEPSLRDLETLVSYCSIIEERARLRNLAALGKSIASQADDSGAKAVEIAEDARKRLIDLSGEQGGGPKLIRQAMEEFDGGLEVMMDPTKRAAGIETPWGNYNRLTNGLQPGELTIIAARPAMGKTAFMLNMAAEFSRFDYRSAVFSLEMSRASLLTRLLIAESRVDSNRYKWGRLNDEERRILTATLTRIREWPLLLDDKADTNILEITAKCNKIPELRVVFVDYLQLLGTTGRRQDSRATLVGEISRGLKLLARGLGVSVVALSQLNRGPEEHGGRRPQLADLRDSGSIEQDADVVATIFRESEYKREREDLKGLAEVDILKNRNGPTGTMKMAWLAEQMRFSGLEEESNEDLKGAVRRASAAGGMR